MSGGSSEFMTIEKRLLESLTCNQHNGDEQDREIVKIQAEETAKQLMALRSKAESMEAALKDIAFGADMVLQVPGNSAFDHFAKEVKRVAKAGIAGLT